MNTKRERLIVILLISILLGLPLPTIQVIGDDTNNIISYSVSVNSFTIQQENGYDVITCEDFGRLLIEGKPNLPSKIISLAIPPGASILDIRFEPSECVRINGVFNIAPCPIPKTLGNVAGSNVHQQLFYTNYHQTYSSDDPYPSCIGEFIGNAHYRKYDLVDIRINPFTYYPLSGIIDYYPTITILITYTITDDSPTVLNDNLMSNEIVAERIIGNYHEAQEWYETTEKNNESLYDYVIITIDSLVSAVDPLVNWETSKGRNVNVVTTSWIDSNYNGYDLQEKMRNFLREKYPSAEWGIVDVLLVGDYDSVPMRRCSQDVGYGQPETDYYYAELSLPDNQSWDADGDHQYGENTDPIDFYTEINIGRIPLSGYTIVGSICNKTVAYEQTNDPSYKENILLLGAFFWDDTDNAELMEEIASQPWMNNWTITRMYEQAQSSYPSDYDLQYSNVLSNWSSSTYGFVNWAGHGSPTACYELYPSQPFVSTATCSSLNDAYSAIIFADACSNQDTDEYNIGQAMMERGAVGFLGATKVAYGMGAWNSPYDGSSQSLDYFFTTLVTSGNYSTGQAHQWALTEMYTHGLWYYVKYEMFEWGAYLGNPDMWMSVSPQLSYSPTSYDFGLIEVNTTDMVTFDIWNNGSGNLHYTLLENCDWLTVNPSTGITTGEHDTITITVNTVGLTPGGYHYDILIITEEAGRDLFSIDMYIPITTEVLDINQNVVDRGYPIRHAFDGDWAAAQNMIPTATYFTRAEVLLRRFGLPEFNLTIELRTDSPTGPLLETVSYSPGDISATWSWVGIDFADIAIIAGTEYFIVIPPAPNGVTTSFGYEWGYAFGNQYDDGAFWFTRDGGSMWRALPTMYDFAFRTYGFF